MQIKQTLTVILAAMMLVACGGAATGAVAECSEAQDNARYPNPGFGTLTITPSTAGSGGGYCWGVAPDTEVTITLDDLPEGYDQVEFRLHTEPEQPAVILGTDDDPSDGFSITATLDGSTPPSMLVAAATDTDGRSDPVT